jgi:hypothetical protein
MLQVKTWVAFSKESTIEGEETQSSRTSGVVFGSTTGQMISVNPIKIIGGKFNLNGQFFDVLGSQHLGYFGAVDLSTPIWLDNHNHPYGNRLTYDKSTHYGDYSVVKKLEQTFIIEKPTALKITFVPSGLGEELKLGEANPTRSSVEKYAQQIKHRDIVKIEVRDKQGNILYKGLKLIVLTQIGQSSISVNLQTGENIVSIQTDQTTNNAIGTGGKSVYFELSKSK